MNYYEAEKSEILTEPINCWYALDNGANSTLAGCANDTLTKHNNRATKKGIGQAEKAYHLGLAVAYSDMITQIEGDVL